MLSSQISSYQANSFTLKLQTSSGDKIALNMYDTKSSSMAYKENGDSKSFGLSLRHESGYSFSYEGNGIDEQDKAEIAKALKLARPLLSEYLDNVNGKEADTKEVENSAFDLKNLFPTPKNDNHSNFIKDNILNLFGNTLNEVDKPQNNLISEAKKLFDSLLKQLDKQLSFYA